MKKLIKGMVLLTFIGGAVVLSTILYFGSPNEIIRLGVESIGSQATGTSVKLGSVNLSIWSGKGTLGGLTVANPKGFAEPSAFDLSEISIEIAPASLSSDVIIIKSLKIDGAQITCEQKDLKLNNLKMILDNITAYAGSSPTDEAGQTKVIIEEFIFSGSSAKLKAPLIAAMTLPLPTIKLSGIGRKETGITIAEALPQLIGPIIQTTLKATAEKGLKISLPSAEGVMDAVKDSVNNADKGALGNMKDVGNNAVDGAKKAGKDALDKVKGLNPFK